MRGVVLEATWAPRHEGAARDGRDRPRTASDCYRDPRALLRDVPESAYGPDEVVVGVRACGVCGSDTHCIETDGEGWVLFSGPARFPCVLGHEYAGEVLEVGRDVRHLRPGDLVAGEGMLSCGVCVTCRAGRPNQCPELAMVGFSAPGALAERIVSKERFLWKVDALAERYGDARTALEVAALIEPLACSYNGMFVAAGGFAPGARVVVFGCGPIGLGAVMLARAAGAAQVIAVEGMAERRALASALGADIVVDPQAMPAHLALLEATSGEGADMIVEAAGAALQTMPEIERVFAPGGRMVYLGRTGHRAPVQLDTLVTQAAGIVGARGHSGGGCFPAVIRLMASGRIDPRPMLGPRYPLEQAVEALERSRLRVDAKVLVTNGSTDLGYGR